MIIKLIQIATALIMVGCAVFPSTTTISANSKLDKIVKLLDDLSKEKSTT